MLTESDVVICDISSSSVLGLSSNVKDLISGTNVRVNDMASFFCTLEVGDVNHAKIAIADMVLRFSPYSWYSKWQTLAFTS